MVKKKNLKHNFTIIIDIIFSKHDFSNIFHSHTHSNYIHVLKKKEKKKRGMESHFTPTEYLFPLSLCLWHFLALVRGKQVGILARGFA